jgi:hypothetical protein
MSVGLEFGGQGGAARRGAWRRPESLAAAPAEMVDALIEPYAESGAWPSGRSWERAAARHPARRTYVRLCGSWPAAVAAAEAEAEVVRRRGGRGLPLLPVNNATDG